MGLMYAQRKDRPLEYPHTPCRDSGRAIDRAIRFPAWYALRRRGKFRQRRVVRSQRQTLHLRSHQWLHLKGQGCEWQTR